jgi:hypothetical protein
VSSVFLKDLCLDSLPGFVPQSLCMSGHHCCTGPSAHDKRASGYGTDQDVVAAAHIIASAFLSGFG